MQGMHEAVGFSSERIGDWQPDRMLLYTIPSELQAHDGANLRVKIVVRLGGPHSGWAQDWCPGTAVES